jgi:tetratricopeptide (TPR) repeat protein
MQKVSFIIFILSGFFFIVSLQRPEVENASTDFLLQDDTTTKGMAIHPDAAALYREAVDVYHTPGKVRFDYCLDLLFKADSISPNDPFILEFIGRILYHHNFEIDSALSYFDRAIFYAWDDEMRQRNYYNLGIWYMEMYDIKTACEKWEKAEGFGINYLSDYCKNCSDTTFSENVNDALKLNLSIDKKSINITKVHNPPTMEWCNADLIITNTSHKGLVIKKSLLAYDNFNSSSELYLEAKTSEGEKINFFSEGYSQHFSPNKNFKFSVGKEFKVHLNLTMGHHFFKAGKYEVRVALRPGENIKGLSETYYSNWVPLEIVKGAAQRSYKR